MSHLAVENIMLPIYLATMITAKSDLQQIRANYRSTGANVINNRAQVLIQGEAFLGQINILYDQHLTTWLQTGLQLLWH